MKEHLTKLEKKIDLHQKSHILVTIPFETEKLHHRTIYTCTAPHMLYFIYRTSYMAKTIEKSVMPVINRQKLERSLV